jgi:5-methylcytosine-specific restriction endonuclease McrA
VLSDPHVSEVSKVVKTGPGRQGAVWRRTQAQVMAWAAQQRRPCCLCGRAIDYTLTRVRPLHRSAGTVHHVIGLAQGGDPLDLANLAPAHRGCNTREGNAVRKAHRQARAPLATSASWCG